VNPNTKEMPKSDTGQRSRVSFLGLNAVNFFQAEMVGVILPILGVFLKDRQWRYDSIGVATAAAGLGTLVIQAPAGVLSDRITSRRLLFAVCAFMSGIGFAILPALGDHHAVVDGLLFLVGGIQSFFGPLLGAMALALVGHELLNKTAGTNQGWNHAGNIAAALSAMALVRFFGIKSVFYAVGVSSIVAGASVLLIRREDLDERVATGLSADQARPMPWTALLGDRTILTVFVAIFLFHLANAPILPLTALYVKQLGGSDGLMTATVLTAQLVMVPVALLAGRYGDRWGRKPVLAIAFWILPVRILTYVFARSPQAVVWLQCLDGIGAGIYGVVVISLAADLTRGRGRFNTLAGLFATAVSVGGVLGPIMSGFVVQHMGFKAAFFLFAALACAGAFIFTALVPETKGNADWQRGTMERADQRAVA
jgi:MFS family permease